LYHGVLAGIRGALREHESVSGIIAGVGERDRVARGFGASLERDREVLWSAHQGWWCKSVKRILARTRVSENSRPTPYPVNAPGTGFGAPRIDDSSFTPIGMSDVKGSP